MKLAFIMLAFIWAAHLYGGNVQWLDIIIGFGTGAVLAGWAIEITGNKVPDSWRQWAEKHVPERPFWKKPPKP